MAESVGVFSALGESVNHLGAGLTMARCRGCIRNMSDTRRILFPPLEFCLRGRWDESIVYPCTIENEEIVRGRFEL